MQSRKVVFPFSGFDIGGSHVATFELAQALRKHWATECVFLVAERSKIADEARRLSIPVLDNGEGAIATLPWRARRGLVYGVKRLPARWQIVCGLGRKTILHCNELTGIQAYGVLAKMLGIKVIYHHHALNRMIPPNTTLLRTVDAAVAISDVCRRALDFLPQDRVATVLNPIEVPSSNRAAARARIVAQLGIDPACQLVGFVANFWRRKRPDFFIDVIAALRARHPDVHGIVFGRGADYDVAALTQIARTAGVADAITFAGFLMPAADNIAALDLLLAPALAEPFGRTPIEAALAGTPYVATDDAGHSEIGRRWGGGRLVSRDATPIVFAAVSSVVLSEPSKVLLSPVERAKVATAFSARYHAEQIEAVYAKI
jgi:glycosyltransferase involved in cell wall biosynthesis